MKHKLQRARSLSPGDWGILAEAWLTLPYRWWKSWLGTPRDIASDTAPGSSHDINRLVRLLDAAANHHPRKPTCLRRSLGLKKILERRGIITTLCIGVSRDGPETNAHAWLEYRGQAINDQVGVIAPYSRFPAITEELLRNINAQ